MSSSDGQVIFTAADGKFLLLFACGVPLHFGKQDKACSIPRLAVSLMNCSWKYLIGVDWTMNIIGTDIDGTIYCKFAKDGDMLCLNGRLA